MGVNLSATYITPFSIVFLALSAIAGFLIAYFFFRSRALQSERLSKEQFERASERIAALEQSERDHLRRSDDTSRLLMESRAQIARLESDCHHLNEVIDDKLRRIQTLETLVASADVNLREAFQRESELRSNLVEVKTTLDKERRHNNEKVQALMDIQQQFSDNFKALSQEALQNNNKNFLDLANSKLREFQETAKGDLEKRQQAIQEIISPLRDNLNKLDSNNRELERVRTDAYSSLQEQVKMLRQSDADLRTETSKLVTALRAPKSRGQWGEIQLQRVVEMAGMQEHCNYNEQVSVDTTDGKLIADLIVRLPGNKSIIVDAKAPLDSYLDALDVTEEADRRVKMNLLCTNIRKHVNDLDSKSYWKYFQPAPDFVVLFMPSESVFHAALQHDPSLMEYSIDRRVLLTSPTTLIGMLKSVAYGWRQEALAENAMKISEIGRQIYDRFRIFGDHLARLGKSLEGAVVSYNNVISSTESRLLVSARKLKEFGVAQSQEELPELQPVDRIPTGITSVDLKTEQLIPELEAAGGAVPTLFS